MAVAARPHGTKARPAGRRGSTEARPCYRFRVDVQAKIARFRRMHESGCFVAPNPWDAGSARLLQWLGYEALATTSAGFSFAEGRHDSPTSLELDMVLANVRAIVDATPLPVTADFQAGYGATPAEVAGSVARCLALGVAGISIEDATGDAAAPLFELSEAVERVAAAREAIGDSGVVLTARAECFLVGHPDPLAESIRRLVAYAEAGADCLFAPRLRTDDEIRQVVAAVAPKPVNVIVVDPHGMSVQRLAELGVRRISVGSALARVAWAAVVRAAREATEAGTFTALADAASFELLDGVFRR